MKATMIKTHIIKGVLEIIIMGTEAIVKVEILTIEEVTEAEEVEEGAIIVTLIGEILIKIEMIKIVKVVIILIKNSKLTNK